MANKPQKSAPTSNDAKNVETKTTEQAGNVEKLNEQQAPAPDAKLKPATTAELRQVWLDATRAINDVMAKEGATDDEIMAAQFTAIKAKKSYSDALAGEQAEAAKLASEQKRTEAIAHVCEVLGITPERLNELSKPNEDGKPNTFVTSFQTVFGTKPVQAKQGESGKSLVKTDSTGTTNNEQVYALFDAGQTYDQILAAGFKDGTIRTAAWKGQYKKNNDGTYAKK